MQAHNLIVERSAHYCRDTHHGCALKTPELSFRIAVLHLWGSVGDKLRNTSKLEGRRNVKKYDESLDESPFLHDSWIHGFMDAGSLVFGARIQ